jgi:hypothetical protein
MGPLRLAPSKRPFASGRLKHGSRRRQLLRPNGAANGSAKPTPNWGLCGKPFAVGPLSSPGECPIITGRALKSTKFFAQFSSCGEFSGNFGRLAKACGKSLWRQLGELTLSRLVFDSLRFPSYVCCGGCSARDPASSAGRRAAEPVLVGSARAPSRSLTGLAERRPRRLLIHATAFPLVCFSPRLRPLCPRRSIPLPT